MMKATRSEVPTSKIATSNSATVIASATRLNLMSRDHQRFEDHANGGFLADCTARLTVCNWPVSDLHINLRRSLLNHPIRPHPY